MKQKRMLFESKESRTHGKIRKLFDRMFPNGLKATLGGEMQEITAHSFANYIRAQYRGDAFNNFGAKIAEWYLTGVLSEEPQHANKLNDFKQALSFLITGGHLPEYDSNLNGLSPDELIERFLTRAKEKSLEEKEKLAQATYKRNPDYTIVPIKSFEDAKPYNMYTSWCITSSERAYKDYTKETGMFYFILRKDYKDIPKDANKSRDGLNSPYDDYGLSMIAVGIDGAGNLSTATSRHNHNLSSSEFTADAVYDEKFLSELVGMNFYEAFPPRYTEEDIIQQIINEGEKKFSLTGCDVIFYEDTYYLLDTTNNLLIKDKYGHLMTFKNMPVKLSDNLLRITQQVNNRNRFGVIDSTGKLVIPAENLLISVAGDSLRLIVPKEGTTDRCVQKLVPISELERRL